jgi:hypothetical protein
VKLGSKIPTWADSLGPRLLLNSCPNHPNIRNLPPVRPSVRLPVQPSPNPELCRLPVRNCGALTASNRLHGFTLRRGSASRPLATLEELPWRLCDGSGGAMPRCGCCCSTTSRVDLPRWICGESRVCCPDSKLMVGDR